MLTRRNMLIASVMGLGATSLGLPLATANDWRDKFARLNFGVVSSEEEGINPESFFGRTGFSGSHENGIIAVLNGTYDAAATFWTNEQRSNVARMEGKGMIPKGQIRYVWKSPKLPNSPWAVHADLPAVLTADIRAALVALPTADPVAWKDITDGKSRGIEEISHADFDPIIRMIKDNQRARRNAKSN